MAVWKIEKVEQHSSREIVADGISFVPDHDVTLFVNRPRSGTATPDEIVAILSPTGILATRKE